MYIYYFLMIMHEVAINSILISDCTAKTVDKI